MPEASAAPLPAPDAYLNRVLSDQKIQTLDGEGWAWNAAFWADDFLNAYEVTADRRWLDAARSYYDFLAGKLRRDPDGKLGWIGKPLVGDTSLETETLVGDAILLAPMLRFAELVDENPTLRQDYASAADRYVALASQIMWDKWNQDYVSADGLGSYHSLSRAIIPSTWKWADRAASTISENGNKNYSAALVMTRLWRLTHRSEYRERAEQLFCRAKVTWRYFREDDRVVWNFWEPNGPYDFEGPAVRSWIGVHPDRPYYQANEVSMWVEGYDSGLAFDREDLVRIIHSNRWMIAHDFPGADGTRGAGTVWGALARFDPAIHDSYRGRLLSVSGDPHAAIALAFLDWQDRQGFGWEKRYVKEGNAPALPCPPAQLQDGENIVFAMPVPNRLVDSRSGIHLATSVRGGGQLQIDLLSSGGQKMGTLWSGTIPSSGKTFAPLFDGRNPATGSSLTGVFTVKWLFGNESRTASLSLYPTPATEGKAAVSPPLPYDAAFSRPIPRFWTLTGASVGTDEIGGDLIVGSGQVAELPLPARTRRITFEMKIDSNNHGVQDHSGAMWGLRRSDGSRLLVREVWRPYLKGDDLYGCTDTATNYTFSAFGTPLHRGGGWRKWVIDVVAPGSATITVDDAKPMSISRIGQLSGPPAALVFQGGDEMDDSISLRNVHLE